MNTLFRITAIALINGALYGMEASNSASEGVIFPHSGSVPINVVKKSPSSTPDSSPVGSPSKENFLGEEYFKHLAETFATRDEKKAQSKR